MSDDPARKYMGGYYKHGYDIIKSGQLNKKTAFIFIFIAPLLIAATIFAWSEDIIYAGIADNVVYFLGIQISKHAAKATDAQRIAEDMSLMLIAACVGALGAYVRIVTHFDEVLKNSPSMLDLTIKTFLQIMLGCVTGIVIYWFLRNKFPLGIIYEAPLASVNDAFSPSNNLQNNGGQNTHNFPKLTKHGLGIIVFFGGFLVKELTRQVLIRASSALDGSHSPDPDPKKGPDTPPPPQGKEETPPPSPEQGGNAPKKPPEANTTNQMQRPESPSQQNAYY